MECKSRKSRDTWSNRKLWPWRRKLSNAKPNWILPENVLVKENTIFQQHKRQLYKWTSPNGQHWNQINYILCSWRWRNCIQSAKTRPGADCGSDHQLLVEKHSLKLKKAGKTTGPARYDLNQIPYEDAVEVMHRFKGLNLVKSAWAMNRGLYYCTGGSKQNHPKVKVK